MKQAIIALGLLLAAPAAAQPGEAPAAVDYSRTESWLCLPGRQDACATPLPTAALDPDGYGAVTPSRPGADPPIDCFYVYPTVSRDAGLNSDLSAGPEELAATTVQFARFATVCRPFAPIYRQATLASIPAVLTGRDPMPIFGLAYGDVLAAWRHYLQHHNDGRPFVLIGHSQGTIHLTQLLAREIEGRPEAARMLSALLLGFAVEVPEGQVVGGAFQQTPLCTRAGQTGCVVSYMSFRATNPPPTPSLLGRAIRPGMTAACTNPAALGRAATVPLDSIWYAGPSLTTSPTPIAWSSQGDPPAPFLRTRGLVSAACVHRGPVGYLAVSVNADPEDVRADQIPGDVRIAGRPAPGWGIHLVDVNLALGDLIRVVEAQRDAFLRRR